MKSWPNNQIYKLINVLWSKVYHEGERNEIKIFKIKIKKIFLNPFLLPPKVNCETNLFTEELHEHCFSLDERRKFEQLHYSTIIQLVASNLVFQFSNIHQAAAAAAAAALPPPLQPLLSDLPSTQKKCHASRYPQVEFSGSKPAYLLHYQCHLPVERVWSYTQSQNGGKKKKKRKQKRVVLSRCQIGLLKWFPLNWKDIRECQEHIPLLCCSHPLYHRHSIFLSSTLTPFLFNCLYKANQFYNLLYDTLLHHKRLPDIEQWLGRWSQKPYIVMFDWF